MTECVLDTSALLTFVFKEEGSRKVEAWLDRGATVSTVVLQEFVTRLLQEGFSSDDTEAAVESLGVDVHNHTSTLAFDAASVYASTRNLDLTHVDRSCLALASYLGVPAVTADREWDALDPNLGILIEQVR